MQGSQSVEGSEHAKWILKANHRLTFQNLLVSIQEKILLLPRKEDVVEATFDDIRVVNSCGNRERTSVSNMLTARDGRID